MWSQLAVADTAKMEKYLECLKPNNGRTGTLGSLRSQIKRSGFSFYLYEGARYYLVLCMGRRPRDGRYVIVHCAYSEHGPQPVKIEPAELVPLYLEQIRAYAHAEGVDTFFAPLAENMSPATTAMLRLLAAEPDVTLTLTPAPPGFFEVKLELDLAQVPP